MTPVILLSYFFPPCNLTASHRAMSWAEQLGEFGYYPIVVTRNWDIPVRKQVDLSRPTGTEVRVEKRGAYEVHYVPYHGSARDRRYVARDGQSDVLTKIGTTIEVFGQHFSSAAIPYDNILPYLSELLDRRPEVELMLVSANPYAQFRFAWSLKKRHPRLQWVADYRDDWTTRELNQAQGLINRMLRKLEKKSEADWVGSASRVLSVTDTLTGRISQFTGVKGETVANGYPGDAIESIEPAEKRPGQFTITYSGYIYDEQEFEIFCKAFRRLCALDTALKPVVQFIGLAYHPPSDARIRTLLAGLEDHLIITGRVPLEECIALELASDLLLMVAYGDYKGIPASKLYQYVGCVKPVLLCPSDGDIIESILTKTGLGIVANTEEETLQALKSIVGQASEGKSPVSPDHTEIKFLSRRSQTAKLAQILDSIHNPA